MEAIKSLVIIISLCTNGFLDRFEQKFVRCLKSALADMKTQNMVENLLESGVTTSQKRKSLAWTSMRKSYRKLIGFTFSKADKQTLEY